MDRKYARTCLVSQEFINTLPNNPDFKRPYGRDLLKILWKKDKSSNHHFLFLTTFSDL